MTVSMRERTPPFAKDVREKLVNNANIKDEPWVEIFLTILEMKR